MMIGFNGGLIGEKRTTSTNPSVPGVWTLNEQVLVAGSAWPSSFPRNSLTLYLDAADPSSYPGTGTSWFDLSGNSYTGTLGNAVSYNSSLSGYFVFNGTSASKVTFSTYSQPQYLTTTSFTWSIFMLLPSNQGGNIILGNRQPDLEFTKLTSSSLVYFPDSMSSTMPLNTWQHICVVKNQTNFFYYRNGQQVATMTSTDTKPSRPFGIGADPTGAEPTSCSISQVLVYDRALSQSEAVAIYNAFRSRYGI